MSDEKGKNSQSADDLAEKLFGINVRSSTDGDVGDGLLFDDYDSGDNSIDSLLGLSEPAFTKDASDDADDIDFDRNELRETKSSKGDYADEIDDDLILFTDDDDDDSTFSRSGDGHSKTSSGDDSSTESADNSSHNSSPGHESKIRKVQSQLMGQPCS